MKMKSKAAVVKIYEQWAVWTDSMFRSTFDGQPGTREWRREGEGQKTGMDIPFISLRFIVIMSWHDSLDSTLILTRQHDFEIEATLK